MAVSQQGGRATQGTSQRGGGSSRHERADPPVWSKRVWTGSGHVEVAVWSKTIGDGNEEREVLNTTVRKTYKEGDEYKESRSLRVEELTIAAALLVEAFSFCTNEQQRQ